MVKLSDSIADFLKTAGIEVVFGIIGSANSHIFDSIQKLGFTKIVCMHHEQACVMAMGAYYRTCGKLSAALVTAGGGATNSVTGIVSNWADSIPGFIFSGQESVAFCHKYEKLRMYGTQGLDIIDMTKKVVKYGKRLDDINEFQDVMLEAYTQTVSGRPGPVIIDFPIDIQSKKIEKINWELPIFHTQNQLDVSETVKLLSQSSRPIVICGNGVRLSSSQNDFKSFVEKQSIPFTLTWSAIDVIDSNHPLNFGRFGIYGQRDANFIIQNADLIIVLGSRLALTQVGYDFSTFARKAKLIFVDLDETEFLKYNDRIDLKYVNSCKDYLCNLNKYDKVSNFEDWISYCNDLKHRYCFKEINDDNYVNSYSFIDKLSDKLSDNHIIVTDMGTALLSGHQNIKLKKNQKMFTSLGLGEMGYGIPGAIGAAFASNSPVLCLNCDGGIMMNLQEAHTVIDNDLNLKIVIFNNDGYLMIKHTQKMLFNGKFVSVNRNTGVGLPNFELLMKAFGYEYYKLHHMQDFDETIDAFLNNPKQSVLEVFMHPEQDFLPKVKGVALEDNTIFAPPIEEMSPLLSLDEIKGNMIVELSEKSYQIKR